MNKTKIWVHEKVEDIESNNSPLWIDYTFIDKPKEDQVITIKDDMIEDLSDKSLWENKFGQGKYLIKVSNKMFSPTDNNDFTHILMVIKL